MKEEIIGGLKNAIERGEPMEKAVQSFVKAGYNPQEVRAAANALSQGATSIIHAEEQPVEKPSAPGAPATPSVPEEGKPAEKKKSRRTLIIILIVILILIIGAAAVFLLFPELLEGIL